MCIEYESKYGGAQLSQERQIRRQVLWNEVRKTTLWEVKVGGEGIRADEMEEDREIENGGREKGSQGRVKEREEKEGKEEGREKVERETWQKGERKR